MNNYLSGDYIEEICLISCAIMLAFPELEMRLLRLNIWFDHFSTIYCIAWIWGADLDDRYPYTKMEY